MYHIKADKRAEKSAELIYQALCKCMGEKSFAKITISDIEKISFVSRSTFYRHFDELIDVLYWKCDKCFAEVWSQYKPPQDEVQEDHFIKYYLNYWFKHSEILELLVLAERQDIIYASHENNLEIFLSKCREVFSLKENDYSYFAEIRFGIMMGILNGWIKGGKKESVNELLDILNRQIALFKGKLIV